jgi:hypothetical protein
LDNGINNHEDTKNTTRCTLFNPLYALRVLVVNEF